VATDGLVDVVYDKHFRINHGNNEFAVGRNHINGIEDFWGVAKFRGMNKNTFYLHPKECAFRCNYRKQNLYLTILKISQTEPSVLVVTHKKAQATRRDAEVSPIRINSSCNNEKNRPK
jgi:transposase